MYIHLFVYNSYSFIMGQTIKTTNSGLAGPNYVLNSGFLFVYSRSWINIWINEWMNSMHHVLVLIFNGGWDYEFLQYKVQQICYYVTCVLYGWKLVQENIYCCPCPCLLILMVEIPQFNWLMITCCRYNWQQFSVVTSDIAGHDDFIQAVRDKVVYFRDKMNFK